MYPDSHPLGPVCPFKYREYVVDSVHVFITNRTRDDAISLCTLYLQLPRWVINRKADPTVNPTV